MSRQILWFVGLLLAGWIIVRWLLIGLIPLLLGLLWSAAAQPLVNLTQRFIPRRVSTPVAVLLVAGATLGVANWVMLRLVRDVTEMINWLVRNQDMLMRYWRQLEGEYLAQTENLPPVVLNTINNALIDQGNQLTGVAQAIPGLVVTGLTFLPIVLIMVLVGAVAAYLLAQDPKPVSDRLILYLPPHWRPRAVRLEAAFYYGAVRWIKAQLLIMCGTFVASWLVLHFLLGIPRSFLIALVLAILDLIPILGPGGVLIPWSVIAYYLGNTVQMTGTLGLYLAVLIGRRIAEPKLLAGRDGPSPLAMLIALWFGFYFAGLAGAIGVPMALLISHAMSRPLPEVAGLAAEESLLDEQGADDLSSAEQDAAAAPPAATPPTDAARPSGGEVG